MTLQLKNFREEIKFTQKQMAEHINVSISMYEKIERGKKEASKNFIQAVKLKFPYVDINYIFFSTKPHL